MTGSAGIARPRFGVAVGITMVYPFASSGDSSIDLGYIRPVLQAVADVALAGRVRLYGAFGLEVDGGCCTPSGGVGVRIGL